MVRERDIKTTICYYYTYTRIGKLGKIDYTSCWWGLKQVALLADGMWQGITTQSWPFPSIFPVMFTYLLCVRKLALTIKEINNWELCLNTSVYGVSRHGNKSNKLSILRYSVTFCLLSFRLYFLFTENLWSRLFERSKLCQV